MVPPQTTNAEAGWDRAGWLGPVLDEYLIPDCRRKQCAKWNRTAWFIALRWYIVGKMSLPMLFRAIYHERECPVLNAVPPIAGQAGRIPHPTALTQSSEGESWPK